LVFVKKESYLLLLSDRKVVFRGVFQACVLGGRRSQPINPTPPLLVLDSSGDPYDGPSSWLECCLVQVFS
jgi:hypothetical protein